MVETTFFQSEFEALDGLNLKVSVAITDPEGLSGLVAQDVFAMFENYIAQQDETTADIESDRDPIEALKALLRDRGLEVR